MPVRYLSAAEVRIWSWLYQGWVVIEKYRARRSHVKSLSQSNGHLQLYSCSH
ncbi:hypothetical protein L873DRAFT_1818346, partial [Choiromyces venosus 120613-1]